MSVNAKGLARNHPPAGPREKTDHRSDVLGAHKVSERALASVYLADLIRRHATLSGIAINDAINGIDADAHALLQPELTALYLREALDTLGELVGEVSPDDVIGRVFATFCVGK